MIRVVVVEDSPVQREFLLDVLEQAGDFTVVGTARDGMAGVRETERLRPDIVLMDCHMPETSGLEATRLIMQQCPTPIVIASASLMPDDVQTTFDAIKFGALAVVEKPTAVGAPGHDQLVGRLVRTLRLMADVKVVRRRPPREAAAVEPAGVRSLGAGQGPRVHAVALAGSTGAPGVIADILSSVDGALPVPILVVQHLTRGFVNGFIRWLDSKTELTVELARHGATALPGHVYVAPDGLQMAVCAPGRIALSDGVAEDGFRPSATHLFRSMARAFGARSLGVLLTGMGRDGAAGLFDLHQAGAVTAVQDETSCIVFGMPAEAIRLGAAAHVLPPAQIASLIKSCRNALSEVKDVRPKQIGLA